MSYRSEMNTCPSQSAFFQPYLPLQQIDMLTAGSWLVGTTNSIVTQQRDCQWDLLINVSGTSICRSA